MQGELEIRQHDMTAIAPQHGALKRHDKWQSRIRWDSREHDRTTPQFIEYLLDKGEGEAWMKINSVVVVVVVWLFVLGRFIR